MTRAMFEALLLYQEDTKLVDQKMAVGVECKRLGRAPTRWAQITPA